jgi:hypothetical protein
MQHDPVELRATPDALLSLARSITHYRLEQDPHGQGDVGAVWFQTDQLYLLNVDTLDLAFKFEVFRLGLQTPADWMIQMQANLPRFQKTLAELFELGLPDFPFEVPVEPRPTGELQGWPFRSWRLEIMKRMEFAIAPEYLPGNAEEADEYLRSLPRATAPPGSENSCLTAMGLLFTSLDDGRRILITADGMPGLMRVTDDEDVVQSHLQQCICVPVEEYVTAIGT